MAIRALGPGASREPDLLTRSDLEIPTRQPLRAWYEAAAAARTRRVNVLTIGDSITEGTTLENRYAWKDTIGPPAARVLQKNRWNDTFDHRPAPDYFQSYALGFFEYFALCEALGAVPLRR